jgi:squalene-associated FAD-dependent desaturase
VDRDAHELARALSRAPGVDSPRRVAVIGGGWAGLAAAVRAAERGHHVTLLEMAPHWGGRARGVTVHGLALDNGQHILIGAYTATLALMRSVGAAPECLLERRPLALAYPDGSGLVLPRGAPVPAFVRGVLGARAWRLHERLALLAAALRWRLAGFRTAPQTTVADLARALPARVRADLIEPLCIAALNTPAERASAQAFLRVLRDALFAGPGAADLLLPRVPLSALLPDPAVAWLRRAGARVETTRRVESLARAPGGEWAVDGERHDAVVLACTAHEAGRLAQAIAPAWAVQARAFDYEPIVTVWLRSAGSRLARPMLALRTHDAQAPAQFVFDLGALGGAADVFAFVVSGARGWLDARGLDGTAEAVLRQAGDAIGDWRTPPEIVHTAAEKRATFVCAPGLVRPPATLASGLAAAGDYIAGPYPATLEGAVRAGLAAADLALEPPP